jgi:type II secretory ATPase GspE/PulE/Tfp pilus assembly ATPase PilB-like protein
MSFLNKFRRARGETGLSTVAQLPAADVSLGDVDAPGAGALEASEEARVSTASDNEIVIEDQSSRQTIHLIGDILTAKGGSVDIDEDIRALLVATSTGQFLVSKSHLRAPRVLSAMAKIEMLRGPAKQTIPVAMATIRQIHEIAGRRVRRIDNRSHDNSRMQDDLIKIVDRAARQNASDIHVIVNSDRANLRFRVDGVMRDIEEMVPQYASDLLSAAFALADASDATYQPGAFQGARISTLKTDLPAGVQSLRMQWNPLANDGRYLIMRILYSGAGKATSIEALGYNSMQIKQLMTMTARPVGINVISGPTGSGKSTTLKALLERMIAARDGDINTITIEDPPEYVIGDAQQMPVTNASTQADRAEAFTKAISAGLRSDPDVMMIGEIRDRASADLAIEGALSGHPIYASLHANTAMDILTRLRDMGIEDFKVYDPTVFSGLVGQRLVRQLCTSCRVPLESVRDAGDLDPLFLDRYDHMCSITPQDVMKERHVYVAGAGCEHCSGGYKGRAVLAEVILPDDDFMDLMKENRKREARSWWFEKLGGIDLLGAAWIRALDGAISPIDIERTVALMSPLDAHKYALEQWLGPDKEG